MAITQLKNGFSGLFRISELDIKNRKCKIEKLAQSRNKKNLTWNLNYFHFAPVRLKAAFLKVYDVIMTHYSIKNYLK